MMRGHGILVNRIQMGSRNRLVDGLRGPVNGIWRGLAERAARGERIG